MRKMIVFLCLVAAAFQATSALLPANYDLRTHTAWNLGPVRDQGSPAKRDCGSCYTFAATDVIAMNLAKVNGGKYILLSTQMFLDCMPKMMEANADDELFPSYGSLGCGSGDPDSVLNFAAQQTYGVTTEEAYPYVSGNMTIDNYDTGKCKLPMTKVPRTPKTTISLGKFPNAATLIGSIVLPQIVDEDVMAQALIENGPLISNMQMADGRFRNGSIDYFKDFIDYAPDSIYASPRCKTGEAATRVTHAVVVVGFGTDSIGNKYWICKNSFGPNWGMKGYFYIKRGVNQCGIAFQVSYPIGVAVP